MWGGWYRDETYMGEMAEFLEISKAAAEKNMTSLASVAVFIDEKCFKYGKGGNLAYSIRESLGKIGTPYDCYLASDYERVKNHYRCVILIDPYRTELASGIMADCEKRNVGIFTVDHENAAVTSAKLRDFCRENGVHIYIDNDAVVYANESYLFVHAAGNEMPEIKLPEGRKTRPLFVGGATGTTHPLFVSQLYEFV